MGKIEDLKGMRYGKLTVIKFVEINKNHRASWLCKCDCGKEKLVASHDLKHGIKSYGCLKKENKVLNKRIHNIWGNMVARCYNPQNKRYHDYGGRGIAICDEWRKRYKNFEIWSFQNGYSEELTIDRINNDKGYEPNNCRWITRKENSRNTRRNNFITIMGNKKTISEWAEIYKIHESTISARIKRGWNKEKAVTTPIKNKRKEIE